MYLVETSVRLGYVYLRALPMRGTMEFNVLLKTLENRCCLLRNR